MHRSLRRIALGIVGLLLVLAVSADTTGAAPAPTPSAFPPGIKFELLAEGPPGSLGPSGPQGPGTMFEVLVRIIYAPGAAFAFHAPGPILYYVQQGTLMIQLNQGHAAPFIPSSGPYIHGFPFHGNQPITLPAGLGIYADDGYIGATRYPLLGPRSTVQGAVRGDQNLARKLERLGGVAVLALAVLISMPAAAGARRLGGAVILLVMALGVVGVSFAAIRHSQSDTARSGLRWLAMLLGSVALLVSETLILLVGFGLLLLPVTHVALVTALLGIILQIQFVLRQGHRAPGR